MTVHKDRQIHGNETTEQPHKSKEGAIWTWSGEYCCYG